MYERILVAVDNSEWSDCAVEFALSLAKAIGGTLTANHVYAAKLHDERFRQLEPGLPERYQTEAMLAHQRRIHDNLIGHGLVVISDSYLDSVEARCREAGVPCVRQTVEGRNHEQIVQAANTGGYDLVAVGAYGLGKGKRSLVGSVCERVVRATKRDVFMARERASLAGARLAVAVDGSECSLEAARRAAGLARAFGASLTAVAVYDPFFHRIAFNSVAGVLSAEAAKLFRFREQEVLHDEIIDKGLMTLYQSHLDRAAALAATMGVAVETLVLHGKPYEALLDYAEEARPALLVVGRTGFHRGEGAAPMGSNAENVVRLAKGNVLVVGEPERAAAVETEAEAAGELCWTPEAEVRIQRVPSFVRRMARRSVEKFARGKGYKVITPAVVEEVGHGFGM